VLTSLHRKQLFLGGQCGLKGQSAYAFLGFHSSVRQ
jgi:hypothetical protein